MALFQPHVQKSTSFTIKKCWQLHKIPYYRHQLLELKSNLGIGNIMLPTYSIFGLLSTIDYHQVIIMVG